MNYSNASLRKLLVEMNLKGTANQIRVINLLIKEPITKTKVAKEIKLSKNTVFYMLEKFEANGMLKFIPNWNDMRGQLITLSDDFLNKILHKPMLSI